LLVESTDYCPAEAAKRSDQERFFLISDDGMRDAFRMNARGIHLLFAVIIGDAPDTQAGATRCDEERRKFLEAFKRSGRLVLEGTYGESGSLMLIDAASTNDALAFLHNDPYVLASSRVQIRPLSLNLVGNLDGARPVEQKQKGAKRRPRRRGGVTLIEGRKRQDLG
jgi:uncharacterized protein YciI